MNNEPSQRPWFVQNYVHHPGQPLMCDANGECVADDVSDANAALIVDAVNHMDYDLSIRTELNDARTEIDRLRDELAHKAKNYEAVIAYHQRTEESLRDIVRRLITIRRNLIWRKDERTGLMYYDTTIDEDDARRTIEEARAAIGEKK